MGEAKRRGTYEQRSRLAIDKKEKAARALEKEKLNKSVLDFTPKQEPKE